MTPQRRLLLVLMTATLTSSFAVCLFPPFFPRLAEEKGATATIYGFVIGVNCLTSFLVTPMIGKNLPKVGVKFAMVTGMFMGGICCAISGFLEFFSPGAWFVVTAIMIRAVHATGNACVITSTFTYCAIEYDQAVGQIFSLTRAVMNIAQLLGPLVGGALHQAGGFYLPFVTMGSLQFTVGFLALFLLTEPNMKNDNNNVESEQDKNSEIKKKSALKTISILHILAIPSIWFSFVTFIVATVCNGFLSINLEPKVLRRFDLSPFWVGLLFGIKDGANSFSSPLWGYFCDKKSKTSVKPYMIISALLVASSFVLMGGGSIVKLDITLTLPLLVFALCLNGVGIGGEQVAGVVDALHEAVNAGFPDDPAMHGIIAGLWSSLSGAGRFVSRLGSGILVDHIGFDNTAGIVTALQVITAGVTFVYMSFWECSLKRQRSVHWEDMTTVIDDDEVVFAETNSPTESLMGKSVSIDVPRNMRRQRPRESMNSLPVRPTSTATSCSSFSSSLRMPHSLMNEP